MEYERAYNDLIARINEVKEKPSLCMKDKHHYNGYVETGIRDALDYIINPESEDERIRKELIGHCKSLVRMNKDDKVLLSIYEPWIAYLEKQKEQSPFISAEESLGISQEEYNKIVDECIFGEHKEQKPVEWSEEDEEMIARICANLEYLVKEAGSDSKLKEKLEERIKWMIRLKSLRPQPHWKPSEEEMDALRFAAYEFGNSVLSPHSIKNKELASLYEQLTKL